MTEDAERNGGRGGGLRRARKEKFRSIGCPSTMKWLF